MSQIRPYAGGQAWSEKSLERLNLCGEILHAILCVAFAILATVGVSDHIASKIVSCRSRSSRLFTNESLDYTILVIVCILGFIHGFKQRDPSIYNEHLHAGMEASTRILLPEK